MSKQQPEYNLQKQVCQYLNLQYPKVLYLSDTIASVKLTKPQANRNKSIQKDDFKTPDLLIFYPNKYFHGLFIELKVESPFKKDGTLYKNEHIEAQAKTINELKELDYYACFRWTFEDCKSTIDFYMKLEKYK